jgi:lysophospholipase L1-like esterase
MGSKIKKLSVNLLLSLSIFLIMGIISELVLRLVLNRSDTSPDAQLLLSLERPSKVPGLFWELTPDYRSPEYQINSSGFRDYEFEKQKLPGYFRIAHLGDSITFGQGVHDLGSLYPKLLESVLNKQGRGHFETYNFGVPGYNTWQEFVQLKEVVLPYQPDLVVLGFCFNDSEGEIMMRTSEGLQQYKDTIKSSKGNITDYLKKSYLVLATKNLVEEIGLKLFDYYPNYIDLKIKDTRWSRMKEELLKMKVYLSEREIPLVVVIFPYTYQLRFEENRSQAQKDIISFLENNGFDYIDMFPNFREFLIEHKFDYYKLIVKGIKDGHPTAEGHALVAKKLFDYLIANRFLEFKKS